jgi:hypothetical protein
MYAYGSPAVSLFFTERNAVLHPAGAVSADTREGSAKVSGLCRYRTRSGILFKLFSDLADTYQHLFRERGDPVTEVVLDLPEPALLVIVPDKVADEDIAGHRQGDDHGQGHAEVDGEEVLEKLCVRGDDTEVEHDLGPRRPPGIPLLEECKGIEQPVILCHGYIFLGRG